MDIWVSILETLMNNAAMNILMQVSVRTYVFISLGCKPRRRIVRSSGFHKPTSILFKNSKLFWLHHFTFSQVMYEDYALTPNPHSKSWVKLLSSFV